MLGQEQPAKAQRPARHRNTNVLLDHRGGWRTEARPPERGFFRAQWRLGRADRPAPAGPYEKAAANPTPTRLIRMYQPKATDMVVAIFSLLMREKPMPARTRIQMAMTSTADAAL